MPKSPIKRGLCYTEYTIALFSPAFVVSSTLLFSRASRGHRELGNTSCCAGGTAASASPPSGFAVPPRNKTILATFLGFPRKMDPLAWRAGPTRLWVPARSRAEREKSMTEEITIRHTATEATSAVPSGQQGVTEAGTARELETQSQDLFSLSFQCSRAPFLRRLADRVHERRAPYAIR